jgi:hypothetical protein
MTPSKANPKNKEARFLTKQISRHEIEKRINKKQRCKKIAIEIIRTEFDIKIK